MLQSVCFYGAISVRNVYEMSGRAEYEGWVKLEDWISEETREIGILLVILFNKQALQCKQQQHQPEVAPVQIIVRLHAHSQTLNSQKL